MKLKLLISTAVLIQLSFSQQSQIEVGRFEQYYRDSLRFEVDFRQDADIDTNGGASLDATMRVSDNIDPVTSYDEVTENYCKGNRVPFDQCMYFDHNIRLFHYGPISDKLWTGNIELTLINNETKAEWECFNGRFTREAQASNGAIQYFDIPIPEG